MDYSKTVNIPKTAFPMKANLVKREPETLKKWAEANIYKKILNERIDDKIYILHDGPPYANGSIHMGTSLNKIIKDVIVKHKSMYGFKTLYVPGWDCHGLPIELHVSKDLGDKCREMPKIDIRKKCRIYANKYVNIQMEEFKRLGVFGDFDNPYLTMSEGYETKIVEIFGKIFEKGYIYKNKKPIYWCSTCVTALAEAEVEYDNHTSPSIYVKFKADPSTISFDKVNKDSVYVVIWTTTPWTLPANLASCFHPNFPYSAYKFGDEYYIVADGLVDEIVNITGKEKGESIPLNRDQIEKLRIYHPFIERESKIIFGNHVTLEQGTGIVHTAPGHGLEDYVIGLEYGLDVFSPIDDEGRFTDEFPEMKGIHVFDANQRVVDLLKEKKALIFSNNIEHSYPHCWRCKKPLIFRATEQWFLKIDYKDLRSLTMKAVDETQWIPAWGEARFKGMVEGRPDWCLSRQRSWGVPIPSFICKKCKKNLMNSESILHFSKISEERGIDAWYIDDIEDLIPDNIKCLDCGSMEFEKEFDILDVWFDSGVSHFAVLDEWDDHSWPADLYLEGSDQHRGWFQSSIWTAVSLRGRAPFNTVLTHGFILAEDGKAMSKSLGNVIHPFEVINKYGADVLRLWVSSEDYRDDMKIGFEIIKQISDSYRRIRNTFRFIIGNLSDFSADDAIKYDDLPDIDKWILHKLYILSERTIKSYDAFEFHLVYRRIINFCAVELSSIYFDISKDVLYIEEKNSEKRRATQTALKIINETLLRLIAPILVFTSEEIWQFLGNSDSIHTKKYNQLEEKFNNPEIEKRMERLVEVKKDILKALEIKRKDKIIRTSLETEIKLYIENNEVRRSFSKMGDDINKFFQVSNVDVLSEKTDLMEDFDHSSVEVQKTKGEKCERCWNFSFELGKNSDHPKLCPRCTEIILRINS